MTLLLFEFNDMHHSTIWTYFYKNYYLNNQLIEATVISYSKYLAIGSDFLACICSATNSASLSR
jgi:hypothetical protein